MLKIRRDDKTLTALERKSLPDVGLMERQDLQEMIVKVPDVFFGDMGEELLLLGPEVRPSDLVDDRIDLLAVDQQGVCVVIELKRGNDKLHLLQALSYASMMAAWEGEDLVRQRSGFVGQAHEDTRDEIEQFLLEDIGKLNEEQRVILLAEDFDYEVLVTAEWLTEVYGLDIRCYKLVLSADGEDEFLSCMCIYPTPELKDHAKRRKRTIGPPSRWPDWEAALAGIENEHVTEFFHSELSAGAESYLKYRALFYRVGGKRRFSLDARKKNVYGWQDGRFQADLDFWRQRLSLKEKIQPVGDGKCLRFYLSTPEDFLAFKKALSNELTRAEFVRNDELPSQEAE